MSYDHPRDRLELLLKEVVDDSTPGTDRRTRFESFMQGIVTSGLTPAEARNRLELYLTELSGRAGGGSPPTGTISITTNGDHDVTSYATAHVAVPGITPSGTLNITSNGTHDVTNYATAAVNVPSGSTLNFDSRKISGIPSGAVNLGWQPDKLVVSYVWKDPEYDPDDPDHNVAMTMHSLTLTGTTDITGEDDIVTFTSTGYSCNFQGTGFNDFPEDYSDFVFTAVGLGQ